MYWIGFKLGYTPVQMPKTLAEHVGERMVITCAKCSHEFSHDVANLILITGENTTLHSVRTRAVCRKCNSRGDNTYHMVPQS